MNKEKISSQEIIDLVASKASVSKRAAEEFLKVMIASVEEGLLAGEVVKIKSFGTFKLQWNEPRKSVNIQTGEEIMINGYYKVVFIPDSVLKEQVNEPFAHLEPVELDTISQKNEIIEEADDALNPLHIFTEQATEIKNLLSEIQAITPNPISTTPESQQPAKNKLEEEAIQEIRPVEAIQDIQSDVTEHDDETIQDVQQDETKKEAETVQDVQPTEIIKEVETIPEAVENVQTPDEKQPDENLKNPDDNNPNEPVILQEPLEKIIEKEVEIKPIPSD